METFGAMWLDTARTLMRRKALSVELLYAEDGDAGIADVADRVRQLLDLQVRVLLRVDVGRGQTVPVEGDYDGSLHTYSNVLACRDLGLDPAAEPAYVHELRNPDWNNCQYGTRVYEFRHRQPGDT